MIGQIQGLLHVVRDKNNGLVQLLLQPLDLQLEGAAGHGVQGAEGFVHQHHRGRGGQGPEDADALLQAVYLILSVERYQYPIYSYNYGVELVDLIGQPKDFVMSEVKRRITEALTQDDRINSVDGWEFETGRNWVTARFTVHTIYGDVSAEKEVDI